MIRKKFLPLCKTFYFKTTQDNTPVFKEEYNSSIYTVNENEIAPLQIVQIVATDADSLGIKPSPNHHLCDTNIQFFCWSLLLTFLLDLYGKVSYLLVDGENNGKEKFNMDINNGSLTACPGEYEWYNNSVFHLEVKAVDYYRPGSSCNLSRIIL